MNYDAGVEFDVDILCNVLLCLAALFGFAYSLIKFFRPKKSLYKKMIGCALGCMFIERLYGIVQFFIVGSIPFEFQVGTFGTIGCYLFIFSANYGAMDSLIDDGSPELKKYRRIALVAPLITLASAIAILPMTMLWGRKITCAIEELFVGASAYFSLKHLIIPKKYSDFLSSLRPFHILSLVMAAGTTIENIFWCDMVESQALWFIPYTMLFVSMLLLSPVLERGTKQWRI